jgi:hypothetical protein
MIPFCDNPLCRLHAVEISGPEFDVADYVEANGKKVRAKRRIIADVATKETWAFCDICANSVAMVNSPQQETKKNEPE